MPGRHVDDELAVGGRQHSEGEDGEPHTSGEPRGECGAGGGRGTTPPGASPPCPGGSRGTPGRGGSTRRALLGMALLGMALRGLGLMRRGLFGKQRLRRVTHGRHARKQGNEGARRNHLTRGQTSGRLMIMPIRTKKTRARIKFANAVFPPPQKTLETEHQAVGKRIFRGFIRQGQSSETRPCGCAQCRRRGHGGRRAGFLAGRHARPVTSHCAGRDERRVPARIALVMNLA